MHLSPITSSHDLLFGTIVSKISSNNGAFQGDSPVHQRFRSSSQIWGTGLIWAAQCTFPILSGSGLLSECLTQQWSIYLEFSFSLSAEFRISEQLINVTFNNSRGKQVICYIINKNLQPGQSSCTMNCRTPSVTQRIIKAYLSPSLTTKGHVHICLRAISSRPLARPTTAKWPKAAAYGPKLTSAVSTAQGTCLKWRSQGAVSVAAPRMSLHKRLSRAPLHTTTPCSFSLECPIITSSLTSLSL